MSDNSRRWELVGKEKKIKWNFFDDNREINVDIRLSSDKCRQIYLWVQMWLRFVEDNRQYPTTNFGVKPGINMASYLMSLALSFFIFNMRILTPTSLGLLWWQYRINVNIYVRCTEIALQKELWLWLYFWIKWNKNCTWSCLTRK